MITIIRINHSQSFSIILNHYQLLSAVHPSLLIQQYEISVISGDSNDLIHHYESLHHRVAHRGASPDQIPNTATLQMLDQAIGSTSCSLP